MNEFHRVFFWLTVLYKRVITIDCSLESIHLFLIEKDFFMTNNCDAEGNGRGPMNAGTFCALFVGMYILLSNLPQDFNLLNFIYTLLHLYFCFLKNFNSVLFLFYERNFHRYLL